MPIVILGNKGPNLPSGLDQLPVTTDDIEKCLLRELGQYPGIQDMDSREGEPPRTVFLKKLGDDKENKGLKAPILRNEPK